MDPSTGNVTAVVALANCNPLSPTRSRVGTIDGAGPCKRWRAGGDFASATSDRYVGCARAKIDEQRRRRRTEHDALSQPSAGPSFHVPGQPSGASTSRYRAITPKTLTLPLSPRYPWQLSDLPVPGPAFPWAKLEAATSSSRVAGRRKREESNPSSRRR